MKHNASPKLRPTGWDAVVALAVLLLAIGTAVVFYGGLGSSGHVTATITHKGEVVDKVILSALNEEKTVTIDGTYHLTIALTEEGVQVTESDCPTQDCVRTGTISRPGQSIVCLPEQVVVRLDGEGDGPDIILG